MRVLTVRKTGKKRGYCGILVTTKFFTSCDVSVNVEGMRDGDEGG